MAATIVLLLVAPSCARTDTTAGHHDGGAAQARLADSEGDPRLRACIEGAGYNWDEVWPPWNSPEPAPDGSLWADPAFQKDYEGCLVEVGFMEPFDQARIARESREVLKYVGCMRDRGWNLSDPEPSDSSLHPGLLDPPISIPKDPEAADQYYRDSADCGLPHYDEKDNLLPLGG
ncbi:MAG TPA: hypothetical protein VM784_09995 [Actinomycetota bacterium]|nr:hypothetical protein [Actinomycetota bacterium]